MVKVVREPQMLQEIHVLSPLIGLLHKARVGSRHHFIKEDLVETRQAVPNHIRPATT